MQLQKQKLRKQRNSLKRNPQEEAGSRAMLNESLMGERRYRSVEMRYFVWENSRWDDQFGVGRRFW